MVYEGNIKKIEEKRLTMYLANKRKSKKVTPMSTVCQFHYLQNKAYDIKIEQNITRVIYQY